MLDKPATKHITDNPSAEEASSRRAEPKGTLTPGAHPGTKEMADVVEAGKLCVRFDVQPGRRQLTRCRMTPSPHFPIAAAIYPRTTSERR